MHVRRLLFISLASLISAMLCMTPCNAQEYAGWVIAPQAMQGIKRLLVAWNSGNASYSKGAAERAVKCFADNKLQGIEVALWDGKPFDMATFDALFVIEAFHLSDRRSTIDIYTKDRLRGTIGDGYSRAVVTAEVDATWCTIYLLPVEPGPLQLVQPSAPRWLGAIAYINSDGGGGLGFEDPSSNFPSPGPAHLYSVIPMGLVNSFVRDMRLIDPENWR